MSLEKVIESQIQDAIAAGAFDNLPGAGKPLPASDHEKLAGENWLGYKMLQNGGVLPPWLGLGKEIEADLAHLGRLESQFLSLVEHCRVSGQWRRNESALRYALIRLEDAARQLRKKQDSYNVNAPGIRTERPGIWVEHCLERLTAHARASGCPFELG